MNKKVIAAGAASAVLAAMPVVGALALSEPSTSVTDNLTLTLLPGCTMTRATAYDSSTAPLGYVQAGNGDDTPYTISNTVPIDITAPGTAKEASGQEITVTCTGVAVDANLASGTATGKWLLQAASGNNVSSTAVLGTAANAQVINTGIAGGLDGDTSEWAFRIANGTANDNASNFAIETGYNANIAVPASATTIAKMTYATQDVAAPGVYVFTPTYRVSVAANQSAGTYTGSVTYTIVAEPSA